MTTRKLFLFSLALTSVMPFGAWAELACPPGTRYASKQKADILQEWCERFGSNNEWVRHGPFNESSPRLRIAGEYFNGKKSGTWKVFNSTGDLISHDTWSNGLLNGSFSANYLTGAEAPSASSGSFTNSIREGTWTAWYPDGPPRWKVNYSAGQKDGHEELRNDHGEITEEADYFHGDLKNLTTFYPSGMKRTEEVYGDSPSSYEWSVWNNDGDEVLQGHYRLNRPDGTWVRSGASGKVLRTTTFSDGQVVSNSGEAVPLDYPALMTSPTPSELLERNSNSRSINPAGVWNFIAGAATLTSGMYSGTQISQANWMGLASALEGGIITIFSVGEMFYDFLPNQWEAIKLEPAVTHQDRLDRERDAEQRLKAVSQFESAQSTFTTGFLLLLNGTSLWYDHNVQCSSCEKVAAVATVVSLLPLLTYWARERSVYRQFEDEKSSLLSPSLTATLTPDIYGHEQYATGFRWDW